MMGSGYKPRIFFLLLFHSPLLQDFFRTFLGLWGTNNEYEEWQKYKEEKAKGHNLMPDTLRFICAANDDDPTKIGQHFLEVLPKVCPPEEEHKLWL